MSCREWYDIFKAFVYKSVCYFYHLKVEPYSIHGSFLKLKFLKTEFDEDNGTYAIANVTSHSC